MKRYKKRKVKKIRVFLVLIFLIVIGLTVYLLINNTKRLRGEKINDSIYHYRVSNNDNYVSVEIRDSSIYYFTENNGSYSLHKHNIYKKNSEEVGPIKGNNSNCIFYSNYILCINENADYYDYNLNLLNSKKYDLEDRFEAIYYQDKILYLRDKELYDNDKLIRKIDIKDNDTEYCNEIVIGNNTYLVFRANSNKTYIYYDILNDKFVKHNEDLWKRYDDGFYSVKDNKIISYNILNDDIKTYNLTFNDNSYVNYLKNDMFYFANNNVAYIVDLEKGLINEIDYKFDKEISQVVCDGKYLYVLIYDKDCNVYVIDIDTVNKVTYTFDEYQKYMNNIVDKKVLEIEKKYHVDIVYKDEVNIKNGTFKTDKLENNYILLNALESIEKVLKKFNSEFFDEFRKDNHKGLILYLSGKLTPNDNVDTAPNPAGYTLSENNEFEIVMDISQSVIDTTLCHELMHATEFRMKNSLVEWNNYNPQGYLYGLSYRSTPDDKYTIVEESKNNVYFVDEYAKTFDMEDRARVFENVCGKDNDSLVLKYPHLYEKAKYLKEKMIEEFPSLKEATVFNSMNK